MLRWNARGQHTVEFAILMGTAAVVAISMQLIVRRSIQVGVAGASDMILGEVPRPSPSPSPSASPSPEPDKVGCDPLALATQPSTPSTSKPKAELCVTASAGSDEMGRPSPRGPLRTTISISGITGHSVNDEVRLQVIPEVGLTNPGVSDEPGPEE